MTLKQLIKKTAKAIVLVPLCLLFILVAICVGIYCRFSPRDNNFPRLIWGSTPILNYSYWSRGMAEAGFMSTTFVTHYYSINAREDWDRVLEDEFGAYPNILKPYLAFIDSLLHYDIFVFSFDGYFIGNTPVSRIQAPIFKLAGKFTIIIPYGGDAFVYRRVRSTQLLHGLLMSYPQAAKKQGLVANHLDYWCQNGDVVIPGGLGPDGFGRWDVLVPSSLHIDLSTWRTSERRSQADGTSAPVYIAHAPNHRGFKGTEFVMKSVDELSAEGLQVELLLLEGRKNEEVQRILQNEVDILVEQLIYTGYALNGIEGMASALPVVSNLDDKTYTTPMRRWSFLNECPIASATPESLTSVLRTLVTDPALREALGRAGREYTEKYHGLDSVPRLFCPVIDFLLGKRDSLINLYHPLLGDYRNRVPLVRHPLVENRIVPASEAGD